MDNRYKILLNQTRHYKNEKGINKVGVAISGGSDSVMLLFLLNSIKGLEIKALHCNFHLRGEESNRDEKFVAQLCRQLNVELSINNFDVNSYINSHSGVSLEMACRNLRYDWFREIKKQFSLDRLAVGHNADDNIETFFLNAMRGAGTNGLKGMEYDTGEIWRPLLKTHRNEILNFISFNNLDYITDSSNLTSDFRRNFIRNEIIPLFRSRWVGFDKAMDSTINYVNSENKIVEKRIDQFLPEKGKQLDIETIIKFECPELLIRRYISDLGPFPTTPHEIYSSIKAQKPHARRWKLKNGSVLMKNGRLYLIPDTK